MTAVTIRQRNQLTIPKAIAERAGLHEGVTVDLQYANGVIILTLPTPEDASNALMALAGAGRGVWGHTPDEIDATIREDRRAMDRPSTS